MISAIFYEITNIGYSMRRDHRSEWVVAKLLLATHSAHWAHGATHWRASTHVHTAHWWHSSHLSTHASHHASLSWSWHNSSDLWWSTHLSTKHHLSLHAHSIERLRKLLLLILLFLLLDVIGVLLDGLDSLGHVRHELNEIWHNEFHHVHSPSEFHNDIRFDEVVASVEHGSEQFLVFHFNDGSHESLSEDWVVTLTDGLHGILEQLVLLGNLNTLLVFLLFSIKKS